MTKREIKTLRKKLPKNYSKSVVSAAKDRVTITQVQNFFNGKSVKDSDKEIIVKSATHLIKKYKKKADRLKKMAAAV